jgi:hypothetical protein
VTQRPEHDVILRPDGSGRRGVLASVGLAGLAGAVSACGSSGGAGYGGTSIELG